MSADARGIDQAIRVSGFQGVDRPLTTPKFAPLHRTSNRFADPGNADWKRYPYLPPCGCPARDWLA